MVSFSERTFLVALAGAAGWLAVLGCLTALLFAAGRRRVHLQGG
jgi:hypothetical protein